VRRTLASLLLLTIAVPGQALPARADLPSPTYAVPHPGPVVRGFEPPGHRFGPGHRGVDFGAVIGAVTEGHGPGRSALHWGARLAGEYIDPMLLLSRRVPALVGPGQIQVTDLPNVPSYGAWDGCRSGLAGKLGFLERSPIAEGPGWVLPPNPNPVIGVAGHSSNTDRVPMDLTHLGYPEEQITYLSYRGRHDNPTSSASHPRRDQLHYDAEDTWRGVETAAERLRDQLRAQWRRNPGQAVDLVGHSMGGLVVAYYLVAMHDPADPALPVRRGR
jgi:hypothetical protein